MAFRQLIKKRLGNKSKTTEVDKSSSKRPTAIVKQPKKTVGGIANEVNPTAKNKNNASIPSPTAKSTNQPPQPPQSSDVQTTSAESSTVNSPAGALVISSPPSIPSSPIVNIPPTLRAYTQVRYLWFDSDFISALRTNSKANGTTIAAVLVVAALSAVRTTFEKQAEHHHKKIELPSHQGWVVTNSLRHMLPQSRLLQGGDRQVDEGLKMFGGYAGSVTNSSLKIDDKSQVWERCRIVRKSIATCFRASIQRMKLVNYCYRHPKIWRMIEANTDLSKLSRSYSVEVANLGAWDYPTAETDAGLEDPRLRLDHFGGVVNSSFDGVRGLFTLGVITLGGKMSVAVGYDVMSVHEEDAETFVSSLVRSLTKLKESSNPKITVDEIRK